MATNDSYEQRVVYTGLTRMSNDRNLIKAAYERWQSTHANQAFDVFKIVADLTNFLGLENTERKTLMIAMHAASNRLVDQLTPVPEYIASVNSSGSGENSALMQQKAQQEPVSTATKSPHKVVTERYLQLVCQYAKRFDAQAFRELVLIISDEGLPKLKPNLKRTVEVWATSGLDKINFDENIASEDCEDVALELYVLLSEIIGPVESDIIVNKAIGEVLSLQAAQLFNPRNLL